MAANGAEGVVAMTWNPSGSEKSLSECDIQTYRPSQFGSKGEKNRRLTCISSVMP